MDILITGAGGFVGKNLVKRFADKHDVRCMLFKPEDTSFFKNMGVDISKGDVVDRSSLDGITDNIDIVFNLAAQKKGWVEDEKLSWDVNVLGTKNILQESIESGVGQFVQCSTSSIIGPVNDVPLNEDSKRYDTSRVYYRTKLEGERVVLSKMDEIDVTIISPTLCYGPHDFYHLPIFNAVKSKKIHFVGNGDNIHQPTYAIDMVRGFELVIGNKDAFGEKFLIGAEPKTTAEFINTIAEELGVDIDPLHFPVSIAKAGAYILGNVGGVFGVEPRLNQKVVDFFTENHFYDISKARDVLGYETNVDLREGIRKTIEWYDDNGFL